MCGYSAFWTLLYGSRYFSKKFHNGTPIEESWMNRTNALDFSNLTNYDPNYKPMAGRYNVGETTNFLLSPIMLNGLKQINNGE